jgi:hypothetical protein
MAYNYNIDYLLIGNQGFCGNGSKYLELSARLTARDIDELRSRILAGAQTDWSKNPMNRMTRECPINSVAILNIFEEVG